MAEVEAKQAWWSRALLIGGVMAVVMLLVGALGTRFGMWPFTFGFLLAAGAVLLAVISLIGGLVGTIVAWRGQRREDLAPAAIGTVLSAVVVAVLLVQFSQAGQVPGIHDIATDVANPPMFSEATMAARQAAAANPLARTPEVVAAQQTGYPDLAPLVSPLAPSDAYQRALAAIRALGWTQTHSDSDARVLEATVTSFWFGFTDDIVVRITPAPGGSIIDVRSVSRVGQGDLGANAARIRAFRAAFTDLKA